MFKTILGNARPIKYTIIVMSIVETLQVPKLVCLNLRHSR